MKGEIDKGQVTISELKGKLTVNLSKRSSSIRARRR